MRIKVSQTTDLEKIPEKLETLSIEGLVDLERCAEQAKVLCAALITGKVHASLSIMEQLRLLLYALDSKIQDAQDIATSFISIMEQAAAEQAAAEEPAAEQAATQEQVSEKLEIDYSLEKAEMGEFDFSTDSQSAPQEEDGEVDAEEGVHNDSEA